MPTFENYPYTNFHDLNLDWIIKTMKEQVADISNYEANTDTIIQGYAEQLQQFSDSYGNLEILGNAIVGTEANNILFNKNLGAPSFQGPSTGVSAKGILNNDLDLAVPDKNGVEFYAGANLSADPAAIASGVRVLCMSIRFSGSAATTNLHYMQILRSEQDTIQYIRTGVNSGNGIVWSDWADNTTVAEAVHATSADSATTAQTANYATTAGTANSATTATNANYATSAGTADSATSADSATTATSAGTVARTDLTSANANDYYDNTKPFSMFLAPPLSQNVPSSQSGENALIVCFSTGTYTMQFAWFMYSSYDIYVRTRSSSGSWTTWQRLSKTTA